MEARLTPGDMGQSAGLASSTPNFAPGFAALCRLPGALSLSLCTPCAFSAGLPSSDHDGPPSRFWLLVRTLPNTNHFFVWSFHEKAPIRNRTGRHFFAPDRRFCLLQPRQPWGAATTNTAGTELTDAAKQQVLENYGKLPLRFEANTGHFDEQFKFLARGQGIPPVFNHQ